MSNAPLIAFTEPNRPKNLQTRFVTVGGSYVGVTGPGEHSDQNRWDCHGCGDSSSRLEEDLLFCIRPDANSHAASCRAIPLRRLPSVCAPPCWSPPTSRSPPPWPPPRSGPPTSSPRPAAPAPVCRGAGGWWVDGANP